LGAEGSSPARERPRRRGARAASQGHRHGADRGANQGALRPCPGATDTSANTAEAIGVLSNATQRDQDSADGFEFLSMAYHRKGDTPKAQLAAAQGLFLSGKYVEARTQASRAQAQFKEGSPGWLKADDILNYKPPKTDGIFD
jgi:predicted Zn-dependent protease